MAFTVGELNAIIKLDDSSFTRGLDNAGAMMKRLDSVAKKTFTGVATGFTATAAGAGAVTTQLLRTGFAYNQLQQNSRAALATILGSTKAAADQMDRLDEFARKSPFAKQTFIVAQQQLLGFGLEAEKVIPYLEAIQNAVAATGGSNQQLAEIVYVLAQIRAAGKITATDLLQLGQRGIDAATMIGDAMGRSGAEIREMISRGQIDATTALDQIVAGMNKRYAGATNLIKNQMTGALDRVKGASRDLGAELARPFVDPNGGGRALTWVNRWADLIRVAEGHARMFNGTIITDLLPTFAKVDDLLARAVITTSKWDMRNFVSGVRELEKYAPVVAGLSAAFSAVALQRLPMLGFLNPTVAGFLALASASPELRDALDDLGDGAKRLVPPALALAKTFGDLLVDALQAGAPVIESFGGLLIKTAEGLIPLAQAGVQVVHATVPLVQVVGELARVAGGVPAPLLAGVTALLLWRRYATTHAGAIDAITSGLARMRDKTVGAGVAYRGFQRDVQNRAALEGIGNGLATAVVGAERFSAGLGKAKTALKGFAVANAPMLALTALFTVISAVASANAEAAAKTDEYTSTLDKQTGAVTANTHAWAVNESKNHAEAAKELGVSLDVVTRALAGQSDAVKILESNYSKAQRTIQVGTTGETAKTYSRNVTALQEMIQETKNARDAARDAAQGEKALTSELREQNRIIEENNRLTEKRANAKGALKDAEYASADALTRYNEAIRQGVTGSMEQERVLKALVDARNTEIVRLRDSNVEQGKLDERYQAAVAQLREYAKAQLAARGETDLSDASVNRYLESLGLLPPVKSVTLRLKKEASEKDLTEFIERIQKTKGEVKIDLNKTPALQSIAELVGHFDKDHALLTVDANTEGALLKFLAAKGWFDDNTGVFTVDADTDTAKAEIDKFAADIRRERTMPLTVDASGAKADIDVVNLLAKQAQIKPVAANVDAAKYVLSLLEDEIEAGRVKPVDLDTLKAIAADQRLTTLISEVATKPVDASTAEGQKRLEDFRRRIRQAVSVPVGAHEAGGYGSIARTVRGFLPNVISVGVAAFPTRAIPNANGNILQFANGGEYHRAEIAPAGAWRVWAEPETGGEAYIPLAASKRDRSTSILNEVARRFGYHLVPANSRRYADGSGISSNVPLIQNTTPTRVVLEIGGKQIEGVLRELTTDVVVDAWNTLH